ncbi:zinc-binding dehydrogenase [Phytoactinopolyspora halotolerans]|uniref:Zinc-binding dehydrogenase n=1 Tax=Phytoactinopolyspora halotolerans TaxID=1981512 RepID=A0A6L9S8Z8_9ACTN|nr:zinc-binding dehydrogenase [Phytoactinopolyspora halotolerans]NEE01539.1 zinc-binding dehydrogenase [Phytoactinopolyspora halotolerans]
MHAIRQYEFGPAENLRYEEVEDPSPGPGQVRIAVRSAGVHFIDTALRSGQVGGSFPLPELPMTPGREVAGVIDDLGDGVDADWLGARVVAHLGPASGGYAELAVRDVSAIHALPDGLGFDVAVAMIGTGRTTMGILDVAQLSPDDVVLVMAAAGGIGNLLVQTGRNLSATVVGAAGGPDKVRLVRQAGATIAVDYNQPGWTERVREELEGREVTVVLEGLGGELGRQAMELLGPGGRLIMYGWAAGAGQPTRVTTEDLTGRSLTASWALGPAMFRRRDMPALEAASLAEAAEGRLIPAVQAFPLKDAAAAHAALETRATTGKVVLHP